MRARGFTTLALAVLVCFSLFIIACDDNNSSEGLNSEERDAIITAFNALDGDKDDGLSGEEVIESLDADGPEAQSGALTDVKTDDTLPAEHSSETRNIGDELVTEEELTQFHEDFSLDGLSAKDIENIRKAFEASDGDIDMSLSENEIFRVMDGDKDGKISKEELLEFHELVARAPRSVPEQFLLPIEAVFSIQGRGTVVTGVVERGMIYPGDELEVVGFTETFKTRAIDVELTDTTVSQRVSAGPGQSAGILLRGVAPDEVRRGQVLATPGSVESGQRFRADISLLTKEEGGRSAPVFDRFSPDFVFRTLQLSGIVRFPAELEILFPGESAENIVIELASPVAVDKNQSFDINQGGVKVGSGTIAEVLGD